MAGKKGRSGGNRVAGSDPFPQDGLPKPPSSLEKDEIDVWEEIVRMVPPIMLRRADKYQLGVLCRLICTEKALGKIVRDDPADSPVVRTYLATCQSISRLSSQFGLSPVDRQRLRLPVASEEQETGFEQLLARTGAKPN